MKGKMLRISSIVILVAMMGFLPTGKCVPLSDIFSSDTNEDHEASPALQDPIPLLSRNSTTIIKEGNASQVLEALGLLDGIAKNKNESDTQSMAMEIQINLITFNLTGSKAGALDYDDDGYKNEDSGELNDLDMASGEEVENRGIEELFDRLRNTEVKGPVVEEQQKKLMIDRNELKTLGNEYTSAGLCIKIYENMLNDTTPVPTTNAKSVGEDTKDKVLIDGTQAFRFIGPCKLFFSILLELAPSVENQQTLAAKPTPPLRGAMNYEFLRPSPNPNFFPTRTFAPTRTFTATQTFSPTPSPPISEDEIVVDAGVEEVSTEFPQRAIVVDVPASPYYDAEHPLTTGSDNDDMKTIEHEDSGDSSPTEEDENEKKNDCGKSTSIIVLMLFLTPFFATFLLGVNIGSYLQRRNQMAVAKLNMQLQGEKDLIVVKVEKHVKELLTKA